MNFSRSGQAEHVRYSFRAYVIAGYAIVAAATAISIIAIAATVFNMYFTTYAAESTKSTANLAANVISSEYGYSGSLEDLDYAGLAEALQLDDGEALVVSDLEGNELYSSKNAGAGDSSDVVTAAIIGDGRMIGSVSVWSESSSPFMTNLDVSFRDSTYRALIVAGLVATLIALCCGLWFSHILTAPLKQITRTAKEISRGNLTARTGIIGDDEIANLGETFDKMAASIERDRNHEKRLTSDVAHELRTPLMAIQATVEAMIDGVYDRDVEHLQMVDDEVKRLSRMVDALLQLSRLENRSKPVNLEPNDLGDLAEQVVATHEALVAESGRTIELHDQGDVHAMCDKDMIRQALANLISNAIRYTDEGDRIDVYVKKADKWVEIAVKDTGIGLDPEEEKMVFERFWRADSDRGRNSGGLGIGLSVVREIVSQNNGRISVKGEKGAGATFTIELPACE